MEEISLEKLKYPIGKFITPSSISLDQINGYIHQIETLPQRLRWLVQDLMEIQLETPYRPEGWTVRQVIHHLPDSHMNSLIRFKLAMTEDRPLIRPYDEASWAELPDNKAPVEISLDLLGAVHARWVILLRNMSGADWERVFVHPEHREEFRLDEALAMYAWHGNHHLAQIECLVEREGWNKIEGV